MNINKKRQRKRNRKNRRRNNYNIPRQEYTYDMIDGNKTYYPYAYCIYRKGYLTKSLAETHQCEQRQCKSFELFIIGGKKQW